MKLLRKITALTLTALAGLALQGCIYEYPVPVNGVIPGVGEDPSAVNVMVEVTCELSWESLLQQVDFSTKAESEKLHRIIVEVSDNGTILCHDTEYLSEDRFATGRFRHSLSVALKAKEYDIAVWCDVEGEEGGYSFDASDLTRVEITNFSSRAGDDMDCAYAVSSLDLKEYADGEATANVLKEINLQHAGARFEMVSTDVQEFIANNKEALNQGDRFTVYVPFDVGGYSGMNLYTGKIFNTGGFPEFSGWMRLPFAAYDELKIAEGFVFCQYDSEATVKLRVTNSALFTVSQTDSFSFPLKTGYITTVSGDFLTHPIDGILSIDNIWEGEIYFEI